MELKIEKEKLDSFLDEVRGKALASVVYFDFDHGEPIFDEGGYHSLAYGVQFQCEDESCYYLIWDKQYVQFDLKFGAGKIDGEFGKNANYATYDMSNSSKWEERIGQEIISIESNWSYWNFVGKAEKHHYPQDVIVEFEEKKLVIFSAMEIQNEDCFYAMADHLTVFFELETARKYGLQIEKTSYNNE